MSKHPHILNAASNLLGVALVIITGLHLAQRALQSWTDELAVVAALSLSASCLLSYIAIRAEPNASLFERWADRALLCGLFALLTAVVMFAIVER